MARFCTFGGFVRGGEEEIGMGQDVKRRFGALGNSGILL